MNRIARSFFCALAGVALLCAQSAVAEMVVLMDDMSTPNYSSFSFASGGPNDVSFEDFNEYSAGGNPDAYLEAIHEHQVADTDGDLSTSVQSVYENFDVFYNPVSSGAITAISFSLDVQTFDPITDAFFTVSDNTGGNFAGFTSITQDGGWHTIAFSGTNDDFSSRDFAGANDLQFGFGFLSSASEISASYVIGVDNFKVTITTIPEPASAIVLLGALAGVVGVRRVA